MVKTSEFFDRLIERLDRLDPTSIQGYVLRLVREKGLLEAIFHTIREGVLILDRDLRIHYVNAAAIEMLGLPPDIREREPQRISRYLRDLDWRRLVACDPAEWTRVARQELEVFYPHHRFLQFYLVPYHNEVDLDSELGMVTLILHDVTDMRVRAEKTIEAERLNAITMLAAGVAHEIGNPLNGLTIHLQLLARLFRDHPELAGQGEALELLQVANDEVRRLDSIITQFLKAVRPTPLEMAPLKLPDLLSETLRLMKDEIESRGVAVECTWSDDLPRVMGDSTQLKQACYNLMRNAVQAMSAGGKLTISVEAHHDHLALQFRDTGKGITAKEMGNLFNPFYTTKAGGTGLGLVIVERIVRDHGATLGVESEPGQGAVFTIRFPLRDRQVRLLDFHPEPAAAAPAGATPAATPPNHPA